jgi:hypothetical protein
MKRNEAETASPENSKTYLGYVESISGVHTEYHMLRHYLEDPGLTYLCGVQFRVHPTTVVKNSSRRCGRWRLSFTAEQCRSTVCLCVGSPATNRGYGGTRASAGG